MATLVQLFTDALGDLATFDPEDTSGNTNDTAIAAYRAKIDTLQERIGPGGYAGCLIGCLPAYLECRRDNPGPGQAICTAALNQCVLNCQQGV